MTKVYSEKEVVIRMVKVAKNVARWIQDDMANQYESYAEKYGHDSLISYVYDVCKSKAERYEKHYADKLIKILEEDTK